jgi:hypothetical protein
VRVKLVLIEWKASGYRRGKFSLWHRYRPSDFDMSQWSRATVNIDHHIAFDGNFYSGLCIGAQIVEVRSTPTTVEIFLQGPTSRFPLAWSRARTNHHEYANTVLRASSLS